MDNTGLSPEETQRLNEKFDIMLQELKSWRKKFEEKFLNVDKKSDSLESIIKRLENKIAKLDSDTEITHKQIFEKLGHIDNKIDKLNTCNQEEHKKLFENIDRKNHQDIYGHEFKRLNDLVAKNSFRISNLEQHFNQN